MDIIKLDKCFFGPYKYPDRSKTVVECMLQMAQKLHLHTVAEGVETEETVALLQAAGCDTVQGYYFAQPMDVFQFEELFHAGETHKEY